MVICGKCPTKFNLLFSLSLFRFKRDGEGNVEKEGDKPILEFVAIQRKDTKEWAIPGGMVDGGEHVSATLKREFGEEALNSLEDEQKEETKKLIQDFFNAGTKVKFSPLLT